MRRLLSLSLGLLILAGCGEKQESSPVDILHDGDAQPPASFELFDGTSQAPGANPHFFFFPPIADKTPDYSGTADNTLEPTVTVCPFGSWDAAAESCGSPLATFSYDPDPFENVVSRSGDTGYGVVLKTNEYPMQDGEVFRIAVSVLGQALGWADVKVYDNQTYNSFTHTDPDGYIAISDNGNLNIKFRIEDGALEAEYCDPASVEDCDVRIFQYDETGCLQVFENPDQSGALLGSQACVPANSAQLNGEPLNDPFAVILTLEKPEAGVYQGGLVPPGLQVPYFPDLNTDPPGISFDPGSTGVDVVICQVETGPLAIPEDLHPQLRPFIVYADGTTVLPENYSFGAPECEDFQPIASAAGLQERDGFLGHLTQGLARVGSYFLPTPLVARRLHGGLNTTVYDTRTSSPGDGELAPAFESGTQQYVVEFGAILDVDPLNSVASVPTAGQVGFETTITITAQNAQGLPFPFEVPVTVDVASASDNISGSVTYDGDGVYTATYTPTTVGTDVITITIDGTEMAGSPFASNIAPRSVDASSSTFQVSYSEAGSPTTVTVSVIDTEGDPYVYGVDYPIDVTISVTGANTASETGSDPEGDGTYVASYTPTSYGDDEITVTINGAPTGDSPTTVTTAPRPADPAGSSASLLSTAEVPSGGQVDARTDITIDVVNTAGDPYDYADVRPIDVQVSVSGANTVASFAATDADGDGTFDAAYTPTLPGTDYVSITVDGTPIGGSPYASQVAPLSGDINVTVDITGPGIAPEDGLPVQLYSGTTLVETATTDASGVATFVDVDFGSYTVHLPKRDFDVEFTTMTEALDHQTAPGSLTFSGYTSALPEGVAVYRVKDSGNGNAFQYVLNNRSWTSAQNQVRDDVLLAVPGHLATIHSAGENSFVAGLVALQCPNETNEKRCKYQGWIGLTDQAVEGQWTWVTGEPFTFTSWRDGEPSGKNNEDQVEINLFGLWSDENGASSTNEGYVVEWEVVWPDTPPF